MTFRSWVVDSLEETEKFVYEDNDSKPIKENLIGGYINAYVDGSYDVSTGRYSGAAVILLGDNDIVELSKACKAIAASYEMLLANF